jgi:predicted nuclease of predicted toxin-antitoxin system
MADENGLFIRLYIDEDVHESLLPALRQHGYEASNVREVNRRSLSDAEQLAFAAAEGFAIFTFNAADYIALHMAYMANGQSHAGIIVAKQMPIGETLRRLIHFLNRFTKDEVRNQLFWLPAVE